MGHQHQANNFEWVHCLGCGKPFPRQKDKRIRRRTWRGKVKGQLVLMNRRVTCSRPCSKIYNRIVNRVTQREKIKLRLRNQLKVEDETL